jgi:hypothetical protein
MTMNSDSKDWIKSSITSLLSFGFESDTARNIFRTTPPPLRALLHQALKHYDSSEIEKGKFKQKSIHHLVIADVNINPSTPEENVEDIEAGQSSCCGQWEIQKPSFGYIHVSVPQHSFDRRRIIFDSQVSEIFSVNEADVYGMLDCPKSNFLFDTIDFVSMMVYELENIGDDETIQYLRIMPPLSEAKLVSVQTRKCFVESGKSHEVNAIAKYSLERLLFACHPHHVPFNI